MAASTDIFAIGVAIRSKNDHFRGFSRQGPHGFPHAGSRSHSSGSASSTPFRHDGGGARSTDQTAGKKFGEKELRNAIPDSPRSQETLGRLPEGLGAESRLPRPRRAPHLGDGGAQRAGGPRRAPQHPRLQFFSRCPEEAGAEEATQGRFSALRDEVTRPGEPRAMAVVGWGESGWGGRPVRLLGARGGGFVFVPAPGTRACLPCLAQADAGCWDTSARQGGVGCGRRG